MVGYAFIGAKHMKCNHTTTLDFKGLIIRAAGLIALTRRLTRLSINRIKIFNRVLIVIFSASHFLL